MVRATPTRPPPPKNPNTVLEALASLSLAPHQRREEHNLALPSKDDEIRRHIGIHMGPDPTYDDMSVFFASYMELYVLYDAEASSYHDGSSSGPGALLSRLRYARTVLMALVTRSHLPTSDDLEFTGMVDGGEDLFFNMLCTDLDSDLSPPASSEEESLSDEDDKDRLTFAAPSEVHTKWGTTHGSSRMDHRA